MQNGGDATSAAYCADAGAKPSCGTIASAGGATADCSASMNGVTSSYTAGADNCGTSAAIRVTNNCYAGVCQ